MSRRSQTRFILRPLALEESGIPDHVDDPVLAKSLLELSYNLVAEEMTPYGWDLPPRLGLIRSRRAEISSDLIGVYLQCHFIPFFDDLFSRYMQQGGRPHHAILHVAEAWEALLAKESRFRGINEDVVAVTMLHEGWGLFHQGSEEDAADMQRAAKQREIHKHPQRVEARMVSLIGPGGLRVQYLGPRDGVPQTIVGQARPGVHAGDGAYFAGDVPNALQYLLETVQLGRTPGEWLEWEKQYPYTRD